MLRYAHIACLVVTKGPVLIIITSGIYYVSIMKQRFGYVRLEDYRELETFLTS
jgi:hypothetical protein